MKRKNSGICKRFYFLLVLSLFFGESVCLYADAHAQVVPTKPATFARKVVSPRIDTKTKKRAVEIATEFAGLKKIKSVTYPRVVSSHTQFVNVLGIDKDKVEVMVGVDPKIGEVVKMVRLCPRKKKEAEYILIPKETAKARCLDFLAKREIPLPKNYVLVEEKEVSVGPWKRWRFVWRHEEKGVKILPDFVLFEVNASEEGNIVSYSKVHHDLLVDTTPVLVSSEAIAKAKEARQKQVGELEALNSTLAVVYPNHYFRKQVWEWSEEQALCWIIQFGKDKQAALEVWIDARTGELQGGVAYHLSIPDVYGIDSPGSTHMQSHLNNIWQPSLEMMRYDTSSFTWTNTNAGVTEAQVTASLSNGRYFIVEGHGDTTATAEKMIIAYTGTEDAKNITPDEVPANNLRYVFLDVCQSGHDGTGLDFKDTFISQGADAFHGFDDYMCAWDYEERLLYYFAQGMPLSNAHNLADADTSPWYSIVITHNAGCINKVRLAPLLVEVSRSPSGDIGATKPFTVSVEVTNREDVHHTAATNVRARLVLPGGFSIVTGANPQNMGTANWNTPKTVSWIVNAPNAPGLYTLDVEVWSDNLGVEVDDPDNPYHKFDVNVTAGGAGCMDWWPW